MKTIASCGLALAILATSCHKQEKPDPLADRVAALEAKVAMQQEQIETVQSNFDGFTSRVRENDRKYRAGMSNLVVSISDKLYDMNAETAQKETNFEEVVKGVILDNASPYKRSTSRPAEQPAFRQGVPEAVYEKIAADALSKWPDNYSMQEAEIKIQIEAYQKLYPQP
jgi:5-hydroxyisourate hydrolase-like protein (transthyretin family)